MQYCSKILTKNTYFVAMEDISSLTQTRGNKYGRKGRACKGIILNCTQLSHTSNEIPPWATIICSLGDLIKVESEDRKTHVSFPKWF